MNINITANHVVHPKSETFVCEVPPICSLCRTSYNPSILSASYNDNMHMNNSYKYRVFVAYYCSACEKCFYATYCGDYTKHMKCESISPMNSSQEKFDKYIENISPMFCIIYNQALEAESHNLTELTGIGYRRALEFLVKDFLIHRNPDEAETIKSQPLGKCIQSIDNKSINTLAEKSAWLGNDHAHYISKHADKTVEDLKKLINATQYFIAMTGVLEDAQTIEKA